MLGWDGFSAASAAAQRRPLDDRGNVKTDIQDTILSDPQVLPFLGLICQRPTGLLPSGRR